VRARGIGCSLLPGRPPVEIGRRAGDCAAIVTDRGYLRHLREWRAEVAAEARCPVTMVEGDVVVPVEAASEKMETAARTIRRKIEARTEAFAHRAGAREVAVKARAPCLGGAIGLDDVGALVAGFDTAHDVAPVTLFTGGPGEASSRLSRFIADDLPGYADNRSNIVERAVSTLSPYLHLGQIAPTTIVDRIGRSTRAAAAADKAAFLEELIVRRELAVNFVHYCDAYDRWQGLPNWARATLEAHAGDDRGTTYSRARLEAAATGDRYWNAAMTEMKKTGYLHNHMRMYWGKRIITFMRSPKAAYETVLYLNNKYFLDGRDANSYANVGWLFGLHDRGWPEREIFGKVRSMTPSGLERKFDVEAYVRWAASL
jgi:deoxyribodipyrimidine photo-lyase